MGVRAVALELTIVVHRMLFCFVFGLPENAEREKGGGNRYVFEERA